MIFENGKYYKHTSGSMLHPIGYLNSTIYGSCLVAEDIKGTLIPVGVEEYNAVNYKEITEADWFNACNWEDGLY